MANGIFRRRPPALAAARAAAIPVVLITNSPRRSADVVAQMNVIGVPASAYDRVVTSGDVTRDLIAEGPRKIFHIGADRDFTLYDGLDVDLVEEFEASGVVCTGLFDDEVEKPEDYADLLRRLRARNLPFICANPDIVVERGERMIWCAGALARDYAQLGGRTLIAGKPYAPVYEVAMKEVADILGRPVERSKVLAIGDGMMTDVKGAADNGFDVLYVSGGIHARDYGEPLATGSGEARGLSRKARLQAGRGHSETAVGLCHDGSLPAHFASTHFGTDAAA